jgi:hypothetical protein
MAEADSADHTDSGPSPADGARRRPAGRGVTGPKFFTNANPWSAPFLWRDDCAAIDVLRSPDDSAPIGTARPVGCTESGIAIWEISLAYAKVPGRWIVLGREFLPKR